MLLDRSSNVHPLLRCSIGVLCLCVMMYALGTTMTLWNLQIELDPVNAPLLEGLSLPAAFMDLNPTLSTASLNDAPPPLRLLLNEQTLFRPPIGRA